MHIMQQALLGAGLVKHVQRNLVCVCYVCLPKLFTDEMLEVSCMHGLLMQLAVLQAMWSDFSEDSVVANNATRQFCTEALTIQAPHERMTDRWFLDPDASQGTTACATNLCKLSQTCRGCS